MVASTAPRRLFETSRGLFRESLSADGNEWVVEGMTIQGNSTRHSHIQARLGDRSRRRPRRMQSTFNLETTFSGDNGNSGAMFDVRSSPGNHTIRIVSLDLHVNLVDPACDVLIYGRPGSHLGYEMRPESWTLLVNTTLDCLGFSLRTHVPSTAFLEVPEISGGGTHAFYVVLPTPNIRYSNGIQIGAPYASNDHIAILEGTGISGHFAGNLIQPRVFNGAVAYEVTGFTANDAVARRETCDAALTTNFTDNMGSYGNMFDVQTYNESITVTGIDFYTDILAPVTYELYTRQGSYVGGLGNVSKWVFLKRGTTNGLGWGVGTPVRDFPAVEISGDEMQGFYLTLTTPDIRYQNISEHFPNIRQGDVYRANQDMEVQVGVGIGTFPLSDSYFGPRAWSGTLHYTADRRCPTAEPSTAPSFSPTTSPPTLQPTISAHEFGDCEAFSRMVTTWGAGTGAYGSFFTVHSHSEPVSITTLEFHVDLSSLVEVIVFTKSGNYSGFEDSPLAWRKIAQTQVMGAGAGQGTVIPDESFDTVHLRPQERMAFYVTLSTPDLRYSRTDVLAGDTYTSGQLLSINAGAGLADPIFGSSIYEPRMFNGAVHFAHTCEPTLATDVTYTFHIEHLTSLTESSLLEAVSRNVRETTVELLGVEPVPQGYALDHELKEETATSKVVIIPGAEEICNPTSVDRICTSVDTTVIFSHADSLSAGAVIYTMLQYSQTITQNLNLSELRARYAGDIATDGDMRVTFKGSFERELSDDEVEYFQDVTQAYLKDQLSSMGVGVLGVELKGQELFVASRERRLQRGPSASSEIDISVSVTGEFRPPPFLDFEKIVEDAIDSNSGAEYMETLRNGGRTRPEGLGSDTVFDQVEEVGAEPESAPLSQISDSDSSVDKSLFGPIVAVLFAVVCLSIVGLYLIRRRRRLARLGSVGAIVDLRGKFDGIRSGPRALFGRKSRRQLFEEDEEIIDAEVSYVHDLEPDCVEDGLFRLNEGDRSKVCDQYLEHDDKSEFSNNQSNRNLGVYQQGSTRTSYSSELVDDVSQMSLSTNATPRRTNLTRAQHTMSGRQQSTERPREVDCLDAKCQEHTDDSEVRQGVMGSYQMGSTRISHRSLVDDGSQRSLSTNETPRHTNLANQRDLKSGTQLSVMEIDSFEDEYHDEDTECRSNDPLFQASDGGAPRSVGSNEESLLKRENDGEEQPLVDFPEEAPPNRDGEEECSFVDEFKLKGRQDLERATEPSSEGQLVLALDDSLQPDSHVVHSSALSPQVACPHVHRISPNVTRSSPGMPPLNPHGVSRNVSPKRFEASAGASLSSNMIPIIGHEAGPERPSPVGFTPSSAFAPLSASSRGTPLANGSPIHNPAQTPSPSAFSTNSAFVRIGSSTRSLTRSYGSPAVIYE